MVDTAIASANASQQLVTQQATDTSGVKSVPSSELRSETETKTEVRPTGEAGKVAAKFVELTSSQLDSLAEQLNDFMKEGQRSLSFVVDKNADEVVISVRDKETDELIRQIPSPEALKLKQHLDGVVGLLFNDRA